MECKVSVLVKRGHDQVAELKSSYGAVDVRDVAQLISDLATQLDVQLARSNALAAENAGLKDSISCHAAGFTVCEACGEENISGNDDVYRALNETPATDDFLAEVRASELDSLAGVAETMLVKFSNQGASEIPEAKSWELVRRQASHRATQLRKGVQS